MLVFDSSTLILLAKSEILLPFLDCYDGKVLIPEEVERECCGVGGYPDALIIKSCIESRSITVCGVAGTDMAAKLVEDFRINKGEAEALVLAIEQKASLVATDDKNAILACKLLKLRFTTAIGILVRLAEKNDLEKKDALDMLFKLANDGRYSALIVVEAMDKIRGLKWQKRKRP